MEPIWTSSDGEFLFYEDGSWDAAQDGQRVHGSAFSRLEMFDLAEELIRIGQSRVGLYDNDRAGEQ